MATKIKSAQILDGAIVAADLHSAIAINTTQSGTFGSVIVDNFTLDGTTLALSSGNLVIDSAGDIHLDTDGQVKLDNNGVLYGNLFNSSNDLGIHVAQADQRLVVSGSDDGTPVNAFILDMANGGRATFNENVVVAGTITGVTDFDSSGDMSVGGDLTVTGDLTVEGTTVSLNTTALDVEDKNITLNYHASNNTSASADGAGITIQDAVDASTDASILWDATNDAFDFSHEITAPSALTLTSNAPRIYLYEADTTDLNTALFSSGGAFTIRTTTDDDSTRTTRLQVSHSTGDIGFYENNGGTPQVGMHWDYADGYLGIGTTSPSTALHVDPGYVTLGTSDGTDNSWINNVEDGNLELVNEGRSTNDGAVRINRKNNPAGDTTYFRDTAIYDGKSNIVLFVDGSEAEVGIGTDAPDHKLHVVGDNDTTLVEFEVGDKAKFNFGADSTSLYTTTFYIDDTGLDIGHDSSYRSLNLKTAGTDRITILPAGNVGIGTDDPEQLLHIHNSSGDWGAEVVLTGRLSTGTPKAEVAFKRGTSGDGAMLVLRSSNGSGDLIDAVTVKDGTGNVGIGTGSPNTPLEIHGSDIATGATTTASSVLRLVRDVVDPTHTLRKDSAVDFMLSRQQAVANNLPYTRLDIRLAGISDYSTPSLDVMSLLHNGNVGIGTTSPSATVHADASGGGVVRVTRLSSSTSAYGQLEHDGASTTLRSTGELKLYAGTNIRSRASVHTFDNGTGTTEYGRFDSSGKLIIGTSTANYTKAKLTILGTPGDPATTGTSTTNVGLRLATNSSNSQAMDLGIYNDTPYGGWIQASNSGGMNNHSPISINPNGGNVGIGTNDPSHNLDVDGAIGVRQVRHSVRPALNLDFANSKALHPRMSFSRLSEATYYDESGILRTAGLNQPRFNHDPETGESLGLLIEYDATNIIPGSRQFSLFSTSRAETIKNRALAPDDTMSAIQIGSDTSSGSRVLHDFGLFTPAANSTYTVSCYAKASGSTTFSMELGTGANNGQSAFDLSAGTASTPTFGGTVSNAVSYIQPIRNGWYRCILVVTHGSSWSGATNIAFYDQTNFNDNGTKKEGILVWGPQIESGTFATSYKPSYIEFTSRSSNATYFDKEGVLRQTSENQLREGYMFDGRSFKPTGPIIEPARTNYFRNSSASNCWFNGQTATQSYGYPDIAGSNHSTKVGSNLTGYTTTNSLSANTHYCYSVFVKNISASSVGFYVDASFGTGFSHTFSTTTWNTATNSALVLADGVKNYGNGWYRMYVTFVTDSDGGIAAPRVQAGSGEAYFCFPQIEEGHTPTSYIHNYGSTATRAADTHYSYQSQPRKSDICTMQGVEDLIPQTTGTIFTEFNYAEPAGGFAGIFEIGNDGITSGIDHRITSSNMQYYVGNSSINAGGYPTPVIPSTTDPRNVYQKTALAYDFDSILNIQAFRNGGLQSSNSSLVSDLYLRDIRLGSIDFNPAYQLNGHIKSFKMYPSRIDDAHGVALTENN